MIQSINKTFFYSVLILFITVFFIPPVSTLSAQHQEHWYHGPARKHMAICGSAEKGKFGCNARVIIDNSNKPLTGLTPTGYGPFQFLTAYNLRGTAVSNPGPIIAIVDAYDQPNIQSDLDNYDTTMGIPALPSCTTTINNSSTPCFQKVNQTGSTSSYPGINSGWDVEISLDVEIAHATCQNCRVLLVESNSDLNDDLMAAVDTAVNLGASVVSGSWGGNEIPSETSYDSHLDKPGVAFTFSAGDSGYGPGYPAASKYVTAVGGTSLYLNPDSSYQSETVWSGTGSGCSVYETKPSWQKDTLCSMRTMNDVSADADPNTGAAIYDSVGYNGQTGWFQIGGTSLSAPLIAGVYAQSVIPPGTLESSILYSSYIPVDESIIGTATPTITFDLDENGDCYASTVDESYNDMVSNNRVHCSGSGTTSMSCTMGNLGADGLKTIYFSCEDSNGNKDTALSNHSVTYDLNTLSPVQSTWIPASGSTIYNATPTITFNLNKDGDCYASSTNDYSYDQMISNNQTQCVGGGTSISCTMPNLGPDGVKDIYIACEDSYGHKDTAGTATHLSYTLHFIPQITALLHSFTGTTTDGNGPSGSLTLSSSGTVLYGMTNSGGTANDGTIFSVNTNGTNFQVLHSFTGTTTDGGAPSFINNFLTLSSSGTVLYGMTNLGGTANTGTIFSINTDGTGFQLLHSFTGGISDGSLPRGSLTLSSSGTVLYGMTYSGGAAGGNGGTIFSINTDGTGFNDMFNFSGSSTGLRPAGSLTLSSSGTVLYGMTTAGGSRGIGVIFSINTNGTGYNVMFQFGSAGATYGYGRSPEGDLTLSSSGTVLYGMVPAGGNGQGGVGTIFSINTNGTNFQLLHDFMGDTNPGDGGDATGDLTISSSGTVLYGMTTLGGSAGNGVIFSINTDGTNFQLVHSFIDSTIDGSSPSGSLTLSNSIFYGMTINGGTANYGTVFLYTTTPPTQSAWSPASGSTITTATPTINLSLNENGDCKSSTEDRSYDNMSTVCTGSATTSISCTTSNLGPNGAKDVYIACEDLLGNKDTADTATHLSYTLNVTPPDVVNVTSSLANGSYTTGQVIPVQINFNENVIVTGTPQLTLSTGSPSTTSVNYSSGSGTSVLTFNYTVTSGNSTVGNATSGYLDYNSTTALSLNGGTIKDSAGNNAILTLSAPGTTNSLSADKSLVVDTAPPVQSAWSPSSGSTITDTPNINFNLNKNGNCYASSTNDYSYDQMLSNNQIECTGAGTTSISCAMSSLNSDG